MNDLIAFNPKRALLSVSDKTGLVPLALALHQQGVALLATGNTANLLRQNNLPVTEVSDCTGFPEILDGRVKTLHPKIHAGLLARGAQDQATLDAHAIQSIDLLIVNLYPFEQVIAQMDCDFHTAIENIDIGGPAMVRSAAKNHEYTYVVVAPKDYEELIHYVENKQVPKDWGLSLAKKAFVQIAAYDAAIANYLTTLDSARVPVGFPESLTCQFSKVADLRYGENPHQHAIFYADKHPPLGSLGQAVLLQGKQLSYNNLLDADAALDCVKSFPSKEPCCVIIKHANPSGIAYGSNLKEAYLAAYQCDPSSAYGGIIAVNQCLDAEVVQTILSQQFVEVIIAPSVDEEAKVLLKQKENVRVLVTGSWLSEEICLDFRKIDGGLLVQEHDFQTLSSLNTVTTKTPSEKEMRDLQFAWLAVKHVKSNAIVYAKNGSTIGIGGGQTSRVMSARIGLWQAEQYGFDPKGAVMASDAFIPFPDTLSLAAAAGITAVIQPGGSVRDAEIIKVAEKYGISMVFTGMRHFRH
jgi:phosphoribosylaminoimidazolecarboxamide formyltransferase/IMP cyclohydrolase